jgi:Fur family ferric uptake transcriptional regulator/Fur family peroxide stress response transcriptional regulator
MAKQGAIVELDFDEMARYDGDMSKHAHFKCKKCGIIYDLPLKSVHITLEEKENIVLEEQQIFYHGHCKECVAKS